MTELSGFEARLAAVEKDIAELKELVKRADPARPWYERLVGSMKDFPEFDEVVRLGREIRMAQRDYATPEE